MEAIAARVKTRFAALAPEERTVEAWGRMVCQEIMHEVADFLAKAVVEEFLTQQGSRWRWKARSRLVRLLNRRVNILAGLPSEIHHAHEEIP